MNQYQDAMREIMHEGFWKKNRTQFDALGVFGMHMKFKMDDGWPLVTVKYVPWKAVIAEMLCFLRGYDNAENFRKLNCMVWDQNANENQTWLQNKWRKGPDDLGRIYGVQARRWEGPDGTHVDQLRTVVDDLAKGIDNRREIVTHWNPAELEKMALPPCHLLYQAGLDPEGGLSLSMYQRSADFGLGVPFNIAGYAWLLMVLAHITGNRPIAFNHFLHDCHLYNNQMEAATLMINREPYPLPTLSINPKIKNLKDLETWVTPDDFELHNYQHHGSLPMEMAV